MPIRNATLNYANTLDGRRHGRFIQEYRTLHKKLFWLTTTKPSLVVPTSPAWVLVIVMNSMS